MIEEYKMTHGDPTMAGVQGGRAGSRAGHQTPSSQMDHHSINGGDSSENTPVSSKLGKMMSVKVLMLDDSITVFQVQVSKGQIGQVSRQFLRGKALVHLFSTSASFTYFT